MLCCLGACISSVHALRRYHSEQRSKRTFEHCSFGSLACHSLLLLSYNSLNVFGILTLLCDLHPCKLQVKLACL